ncbi:hypothetical protein BOTBODRAFT_31487 [Botryobasidium botryosum FD-172 SS1]|uniref:Cleavage stimulation factor subunit 2 hinge domain-containing protein n=1 Tax=Botryobasidium botryosum (strain FD-172 SS1) TaxID=930990 RepID=A0A067MLI1_BOTB1|nr:hypothetical protein BOTBODRAFT_31487 [Botryobasidium botryosum FD-172 SS1]
MAETANALPVDQMMDLLLKLKTMIPAETDQVRTIISSHPQLAPGLVKTMVLLGILDPDVLTKLLASSVQQPAPLAPAPAPPIAPSAPAAVYPSYADNNRPPPSQPAYSNYSQPPFQSQAHPYHQPTPHVPVAVPPPSAYAQPAPPNPAAAFANLSEDERAMLQRVMTFTPEQINQLPPMERAAFMQLRQQFMGPGA